jgi:hypothetical protein
MRSGTGSNAKLRSLPRSAVSRAVGFHWASFSSLRQQNLRVAKYTDGPGPPKFAPVENYPGPAPGPHSPWSPRRGPGPLRKRPGASNSRPASASHVLERHRRASALPAARRLKWLHWPPAGARFDRGKGFVAGWAAAPALERPVPNTGRACLRGLGAGPHGPWAKRRSSHSVPVAMTPVREEAPERPRLRVRSNSTRGSWSLVGCAVCFGYLPFIQSR